MNELSFTGIVERVWEDGFFLNAGNRTLLVDSWDLYGDSTPRYVTVGEQVTISGEFEGGEFDAFSITSDGRIIGGGGNGDRDMIGNNGNNVLRGTNASDDIWCRGGNDRLFGLGGDDDLFGEAGNDSLIGGGGGDDLFGGTGNDSLLGGGGGDDLSGGTGNDSLIGGSGQDDLVGGAGQDTLIGNAGRDTFDLQPGGNDIIRDFQDQVDKLELSGGLRFNGLVFRQQGENMLIFADGNRVALLQGVSTTFITQADFS